MVWYINIYFFLENMCRKRPFESIKYIMCQNGRGNQSLLTLLWVLRSLNSRTHAHLKCWYNRCSIIKKPLNKISFVSTAFYLIPQFACANSGSSVLLIFKAISWNLDEVSPHKFLCCYVNERETFIRSMKLLYCLCYALCICGKKFQLYSTNSRVSARFNVLCLQIFHVCARMHE